VPNSAAQNLRVLRSRKLLVTVPDIANPAFAPVLQGVETAARRQRYTVLLGDTQRQSLNEEPYSIILRRKEADGLIFISHRLPKDTELLVQAAKPRCAPLVNVVEFTPHLGVPCVTIDNAAAAYDAIDHLYGLGHRRIGIIAGPTISPASRDRLRGAKRRARAAGAAGQLIVEHGDWGIPSGITAAEALLDRSPAPTAVLGFNDEMAIGAIEVARRRSLRIPADLSVVGFDDIRIARYLAPPLTTVALPLREMGEQAVRVLLDILGGKIDTPLSIALPHELTVRATTAPPR
jgi:LacI family repressor for deo operon, udp, cdd, tsx, nupC, and nupG